MNIEQISLADLIPYIRNAKKHDKTQVDNVAQSIKEFGIVQPIVVDKDNNIIIGHCRALACKKLKIKTVPVVKLEDLTPEEANKLRLLDNKLNESEWDFELLADDVPELDFSDYDIDWELPKDDEDEPAAEEEPEDDPFADIETGNRYGVPYQGNKSRIADILISVLPAGRRLVDLFGGGGAITHCAMLSDKWEYFLYNDINPMITGLFMDAIHGKYHDERRVITREDFERLKDTDAYVKYIWSFGNNGTGYLWRENIEELKCTACHAIMDDNIQDRRLAYMKYVKLLKSTKGDIKKRIDVDAVDRLQNLERLQAMESLEALERLEAVNISYTDYEYQDGDIVYCDIPYEQSGKKKCDDYGVQFDNAEFYEWAKSRPYQVFFSSYDISDDSFYKIKIKDVQSLIGSNTNGTKVAEYLYSNMPIESEVR